MTMRFEKVDGRLVLVCPKCGRRVPMTRMQEMKIKEKRGDGFSLLCLECSEPSYIWPDEAIVEE